MSDTPAAAVRLTDDETGMLESACEGAGEYLCCRRTVTQRATGMGEFRRPKGSPVGGEMLAAVERIVAARVADALTVARAEVERLHTWAGLLSLLDEHWPEETFPTLTDDPERDTGPRLVSALRRLARVRDLADELARTDMPTWLDGPRAADAIRAALVDVPEGPELATADDVVAGRARYADTPGGHADRETLDKERSGYAIPAPGSGYRVPYDTAVRRLRDFLEVACASGVSTKATLMEVVLAQRRLSLSGPHERELVRRLVAVWDDYEDAEADAR